MEMCGNVEDFRQSDASRDSLSEERCVGRVTSLERRHVDPETNVTQSQPQRSNAESPTMQVGPRPPDAAPLGLRFDQCIQQVRGLEVRRDQLIGDLLRAHAPMLQVVAQLRRQVEEARALLTLAQLDHTSVHEDVQQAKRRLFRAARDCIQSQVTLAAQEYEVAQSSVTQDELKAQMERLHQELSELQVAHRNKLTCLRDEARRPSRCLARALSDVSHCRRASLSLQRRLSGSMRSLEGWYEPRLLALLRRRQAGEEALRKSRELVQDLKAGLVPLEQATRELELQRACLEDRMALMERDRRDSKAQCEEAVNTLEETLRDLKVEFEIQRSSTTHLQSLKDGVLRELAGLRGCNDAIVPTAEDE